MSEEEFDQLIADGTQESILQGIDHVIKEFAAALTYQETVLRDIRELPSPKSVIGLSLLTAIRALPPGEERRNLRELFTCMANFQPMTDAERAAIVAHWTAVMAMSHEGLTSEEKETQVQTIADTGDIVSRFQAMANAEAKNLTQQLRVAAG